MNPFFILRVDFYNRHKDIHDAYYADYILNPIRLVSHLRLRSLHAEEIRS